MTSTYANPTSGTVLPFEGGQLPLPDDGTSEMTEAMETEAEDNQDDDWDQPYQPVEKEKLPIREQDFPIIMRQLLNTSPSNRKVPIFICNAKVKTQDSLSCLYGCSSTKRDSARWS